MSAKVKTRGVRISVFCGCMAALTAVLLIALFAAGLLAYKKHEELSENTAGYIELTKQAEVVEDASDYLTEQVRLCVQTVDMSHAELYFEEANISRRRESALAIMESYELDEGLGERLSLAVENSRKLMQREIYAMTLTADAMGIKYDERLPEIAKTALTLSDSLLTPEQKLEKARTMVFDEEYRHAKAVIYEHLTHFTQGVVYTMETRMTGGLDSLYSMISWEWVALSALAAALAALFIGLWLLVVRPLNRGIASMDKGEQLTPAGTYELKRMANMYNDIYIQRTALAAKQAMAEKTDK